MLLISHMRLPESYIGRKDDKNYFNFVNFLNKGGEALLALS